MEIREQRKGRQSRQPRNQRVDNESANDQNAEPRVGGGDDQMGLVLTHMTDVIELLVT
mgnify:CR=1 FL=1